MNLQFERIIGRIWIGLIYSSHTMKPDSETYRQILKQAENRNSN